MAGGEVRRSRSEVRPNRSLATGGAQHWGEAQRNRSEAQWSRHEDRWNVGNEAQRNVGNEAQRNVGSEANGNARRSENSAGLEATGSESEATGELPRL